MSDQFPETKPAETRWDQRDREAFEKLKAELINSVLDNKARELLEGGEVSAGNFYWQLHRTKQQASEIINQNMMPRGKPETPDATGVTDLNELWKMSRAPKSKE